MFPVRNTSEYESNLDVGFLILQKLKVFPGAGCFTQLQLDVKAREYFPVLPAVIFERGALEGRSHYDRRRRRRDEIGQGERDRPQSADGQSQSLEQLPTTESQHADNTMLYGYRIDQLRLITMSAALSTGPRHTPARQSIEPTLFWRHPKGYATSTHG